MMINEIGVTFNKKLKRDSDISIFIAAPIIFLFFFSCFAMILGLNIKLLLVLIFPVTLLLIGFIYVPYFSRGKMFTRLIKEITINNEKLYLKTFNWYHLKSFSQTVVLNDIEIRNCEGTAFFKGKVVYQLIIKDCNISSYYLVVEFFNNIDLSLLEGYKA